MCGWRSGALEGWNGRAIENRVEENEWRDILKRIE
jgi:hypothetical protein